MVDMLMGSTGAADPILPLSMVASLRHQSIINMNERFGYYMKRSYNTMEQFFSRLFLKLMG
jgi:hypothetical protein